MNVRRSLAAVVLAATVSVTAACGITDDGPSGRDQTSVSSSSVSSEAQLVTLVQEAYGDGSLDLHRGHQPVQDVLDEVLGISHDELHSRMDDGQNLAAVAEHLDIDPQELIDAMVAAWSPAIDTLLEDGTLTQAEADGYEEALTDAFAFRVTWDGSEETPTFSGLDA